MSVRIDAAIAEFQQQIMMLSSRAAKYAAELAVVTAKLEAFKKKDELVDDDKDSTCSE